jgi:holin-like protein
MMRAFLLLIFFELIGDGLHAWLRIPLPGPLMGMFLLTGLLLWKPNAAGAGVTRMARALTSRMALFFVPAGAGVMMEMQRIRAEWLPISVALSVSTVASLLATAFVMQKTVMEAAVGTAAEPTRSLVAESAGGE